MITSFRNRHLLQAISAYEEQSLPIDLFLSGYYRIHKALGSKDRLFLNEKIFLFIRFKNLIEALTEPPFTWEKAIEMLEAYPIEELQGDNRLKDFEKAGFPEWLFLKLKNQWSLKETEDFCKISNEQAPPTIRVNLLKTTREDLLKSLRDQGLEPDITPLSPYGITFKERLNYFEIPEFNQGHFEIQDEGSQLLAELAEIKPQDHVMDFCAGSGGKTLGFAHKMEGKGQIYLHDVRKKVLEDAKKRLRRAGIQNAQIVPAQDGRLKKLKGKMDLVFVDAPCSGTGTLRRNPDMKWKLTPDMIRQLTGQQRAIFEQALSFLSPEGSIVYSTCSVLAEENEQQTDHFLKTYGLELISKPLHLVPVSGGTDGFYGAVFRRTKKTFPKGIL